MSTFSTFISPAAFGLPKWLPGSTWTEHGPFAAWLVEQSRPSVIVELGSFGGYSFCVFCETLKAHNIAAKAIAIDTWAGDEHNGLYGDEVYLPLKAHIDANYGAFAEMKRMYFSEALSSVADGSVDLLHVDGRHFYADVKEDYTSWIPKLSDRAVVLFHDTQVFERGFGVNQYWRELIEQHPGFEFLHGYGLGVLAHGKNAPGIVKQLCAVTPEVRDEVRAAYASLGAGIHAKRHLRLFRDKQQKRRAIRRNPLGFAIDAVRGKLTPQK